MDSKKQLMLGLFFLVTLSILAYYTLFLTDFKLFGERVEITVHFEDAGGLRQGDSILIAGIREGRVGTLTYDPAAQLDRRVTATLLLDADVILREDYEITIEDATLLGGKRVTIDPGLASSTPLADDTVLFGTVSLSPLKGLGELIEENREQMARVVNNVDQLVSGLVEGEGLLGRALSDDALGDELDRGLRGFTATMENSAVISRDLREGRGTIGKLLTDEDLYDEVQEIARNLQSMLDDGAAIAKELESGRGTLSRLIHDEEMGQDIRDAVASVRDIAGRINDGEGTLGRLVVDPEVADNLAEITRALREGDGTLGQLITSSEIYDRLSRVTDDLLVASTALREQKGTLGALVMDDELYGELQRAVETINRTLEEFRESAPVTTFTSVLFGAF